MGKKGKKRRMFPGGNTAVGFHSFFDYIIHSNYKKKYIIKGGPGSGKSTFMYGIGDYMQSKGYDVTEFHCSTDPDSLDAIAIPGLGIALLDGMPPHAVEPNNIGITDHIIWLGEYCSSQKLMNSENEISILNQRANKLFKLAFSHLREAREAYDRWRSIVKDAMIYGEYNKLLRQILDELFGGVEYNMVEEDLSTHAFAAAISGKGYYSYTKELIEPGYRIYGFAGMPGSGAKKIIWEITLEAEKLGLKYEAFHCPIDVDELDMLIIPELKTIIVYMDQFPEDGELLFDYSDLDTYVNFDNHLNQSIMDEYMEDIKKAKDSFKNSMEEAIDCISRARRTHGKIEKYYVDATDFEAIDVKREEVLTEIMELSESDT